MKTFTITQIEAALAAGIIEAISRDHDKEDPGTISGVVLNATLEHLESLNSDVDLLKSVARVGIMVSEEYMATAGPLKRAKVERKIKPLRERLERE